jgi:GTP-binding protein
MEWIMKIVSAEFVAAASHPSRYPDEDLPEAAFVGRSNVGKSSLINTLVQRKSLARTSRTPGCTQQILFYRINNRFSFVDLPGYGFAKVSQAVKKQWGPMVETYLKERGALRLVIFIMDIRRDPSKEDLDLARWLFFYNIPDIFVLTKIDKLSRSQVKVREKVIKTCLSTGSPPESILFSARTGEGKDRIWKVISDRLTWPGRPG